MILKNNKFIERIENEKGILSLLKLEVPGTSFTEFISKRDFELVYSENSMDIKDGSVIQHSRIYKTKQEFYLSLFIGNKGGVSLNIYYNIKQLNELKLFISQLLKEYKKTN
jgi:hypothetical protein